MCPFLIIYLKQRLHATHNLMELLSAKHPGIPPTLRDDRLSDEVIPSVEIKFDFGLFAGL